MTIAQGSTSTAVDAIPTGVAFIALIVDPDSANASTRRYLVNTFDWLVNMFDWAEVDPDPIERLLLAIEPPASSTAAKACCRTPPVCARSADGV
jgi:hypothetical protein